MGGKIWLVSSEPGKGTVFAFSLPVATAEQIKESEMASLNPAEPVGSLRAPLAAEAPTATVAPAAPTAPTVSPAPEPAAPDKPAKRQQ